MKINGIAKAAEVTGSKVENKSIQAHLQVRLLCYDLSFLNGRIDGRFVRSV